MSDPLDLRLLAASAIVRDAGQLAHDYFLRRESLEIEFKGQQDVVSIADRAVEDMIRAQLSRAFPDDDLIGEEGGYATDRGGDPAAFSIAAAAYVQLGTTADRPAAAVVVARLGVGGSVRRWVRRRFARGPRRVA